MDEQELELEQKTLKELLVEEGDFAADYLEELLDIADLDGDIEISVRADRAALAIVAEDDVDRRLKRLIGKRGETLDALQELTRLAVQTQTGVRSRLLLDILGYRDGHRAKIRAIAQSAVEKVLETGEDYALKPMNPFERKVVHDVVMAAGLRSTSHGIGVDRHVVISLDTAELEDEETEYEDYSEELEELVTPESAE